jgi:hypothetical protein
MSLFDRVTALKSLPLPIYAQIATELVKDEFECGEVNSIVEMVKIYRELAKIGVNLMQELGFTVKKGYETAPAMTIKTDNLLITFH